MSRTIRKRSISFRKYFEWDYFLLNRGNDPFGDVYLKSDSIEVTEKKLLKYKYKYYTDLFWKDSLPKHFRKRVNKARKVKSNHELWKEINYKDYVGNYSKYNCKDNDHWSWY